MADNKQRLGALGSGMANRAGQAVSNRNKRTKSRLDKITNDLKSSRPKNKKTVKKKAVPKKDSNVERRSNDLLRGFMKDIRSKK